MGNHFAAIGFPVETYEGFEGFEDLAIRALERGERFETQRGAYVRWSPGAGAELWAQSYESGDFGCVPHFAGEASLPAGLTRRDATLAAPPGHAPWPLEQMRPNGPGGGIGGHENC